jgi:mannose-6-phosphate isomerase class I
VPEPPRYEANPRYPVVAGEVRRGWPASAATLRPAPVVLAVDGPSIAPWQKVVAHLGTVLAARGPVRFVDMREHMVEWDKVLARTDAPVLSGDPHFARLASVELAELFDDLPAIGAPAAGTVVVFGPGAALARHDVLWYADLPKRYAEQAVVAGEGRNLGQPDGAGPATTRQLFYVDWPILDRHRDAVADRIDLWLDVQDPDGPCALEGHALRACLRELVRGPFRTRPTFNTTSWGGHWAQRELGINPTAPNTALGYELIAPESGVLLGSSPDRQVEVPFQLAVACGPDELLGAAVRERFGTSFPIRFDYLDTVDGGNLSVHCHPQADYMHEVFGWPYPQHETYYVMVGGTDRRIYLGLQGGVDVDAFNRRAHDAAEHGIPFDIDQFVQTHPADPHQLFLIPAGTPHGSGTGNVVLEISATPYLYSLRFYDWLRRDRHGAQRPVHVGHAFANLDTRRTGDAVPAQLVQQPRTVRSGPDWFEELLGTAPEMFYEVRRITISGATPAVDDTEGRFHILNVVEGAGVVIHTDRGAHPLVYAETIVIPAIVGPYRLERLGTGPVRVVKSLVRPGYAS